MFLEFLDSYLPSGLLTVRESVLQSPTVKESLGATVPETTPGGDNTIEVYSILSLHTSELALQKV